MDSGIYTKGNLHALQMKLDVLLCVGLTFDLCCPLLSTVAPVGAEITAVVLQAGALSTAPANQTTPCQGIRFLSNHRLHFVSECNKHIHKRSGNYMATDSVMTSQHFLTILI